MPDHSRIMLPSKGAEGRGVEGKKLSGIGCELKPAGRQDSQNMTVSEQCGVAVGCKRPENYALGPCGHLLYGLAVDDTIFPEIPTGPILLDLRS